LPSLYSLDDSGSVIRSGTFSKILGAGMRLGWLCAPVAMIPALQAFNFGGGVAPFTSRVATYYLRDHLEAHVARLIEVYRGKRDAMLRGLDEALAETDAEISRPAGGFFIWIKLPSRTNLARLQDLAADARVQYRAGPQFFPNGGGEEYIRLAYSSETPEKCFEGARLLGEAIAAARG
jgi:DNA-binding transcriptional MocR family regulator